MALSGEDAAVVLLRALPAEVAEVILGRLGADAAARVRARVQAAAAPPTGDELDAALTEFFDVQRIAERPAPVAEQRPATPAPPDPADELRELSPDRVARALEGESPAATALVLAALGPAAGQVLKHLPADARADIGLRLTRPGVRNDALVRQLLGAVAAKARGLGEARPVPSDEERIVALADMLRALPRPERLPVLQKIELADADLAKRVRDLLYRMEDFLKVPDRQLQTLLAELDLKRLALALKGTDPAVKDRVSANMSSRSRVVLDEEAELAGSAPAVRVKEAQQEVLGLLRRYEEEGKVVIEE